MLTFLLTVFEDESLNKQATAAVEKQIHTVEHAPNQTTIEETKA